MVERELRERPETVTIRASGRCASFQELPGMWIPVAGLAGCQGIFAKAELLGRQSAGMGRLIGNGAKCLSFSFCARLVGVAT